MLNWINRGVILLVSGGIGLAVAAAALPRFSLSVTAFVADALIFTVLQCLVSIVLRPLVARVAAAVFATFAALLITYNVGGIQLSGLRTWVIATLLCWIVTVLVAALLSWLASRLRQQRLSVP